MLNARVQLIFYYERVKTIDFVIFKTIENRTVLSNMIFILFRWSRHRLIFVPKSRQTEIVRRPKLTGVISHRVAGIPPAAAKTKMERTILIRPNGGDFYRININTY